MNQDAPEWYTSGSILAEWEIERIRNIGDRTEARRRARKMIAKLREMNLQRVAADIAARRNPVAWEGA